MHSDCDVLASNLLCDLRDANSQTAETSIILDNLVPISNAQFSATGYTHPNILDIKLGTQLYDMDASGEKVARMTRAAAETTSARFGIRLTGGKVTFASLPCA